MVTSELTPSLIGQKKNRHVFRVELVERLEMSIKDTGNIPWLSSQSAEIEKQLQHFKAQLVFRISRQLILSLCMIAEGQNANNRSFVSTLAFMEEKNNSIPELVQQIHKAENQHNQLVDQYFAMKEHVQQALTNLNNDPSSNHMLAYHHYSIHSETIMKAIRAQRQTLTNLICDLQEQGVSLDDDESDNDSFNELSSLDEGIDDHASSVLDASSKLSSHESSEVHPDDDVDDVLV